MAIEIHKISPLDIPNQTLTKCKDLSEHVYNILGYFCQPNKYDEVGWLLLMPLEIVGNEKDGLRKSNSQQKHCINDLSASVAACKETLISSSCRTKMAEIQTQNLILQVTELQHKLNSQPHRVFAVKVRALTGNE